MRILVNFSIVTQILLVFLFFKNNLNLFVHSLTSLAIYKHTHCQPIIFLFLPKREFTSIIFLTHPFPINWLGKNGTFVHFFAPTSISLLFYYKIIVYRAACSLILKKTNILNGVVLPRHVTRHKRIKTKTF